MHYITRTTTYYSLLLLQKVHNAYEYKNILLRPTKTDNNNKKDTYFCELHQNRPDHL